MPQYICTQPEHYDPDKARTIAALHPAQAAEIFVELEDDITYHDIYKIHVLDENDKLTKWEVWTNTSYSYHAYEMKD